MIARTEARRTNSLRPALPGTRARGGPDRVPVRELDPVAPAEGGVELLFRGGNAEPLRVGHGLHPASGEHWCHRAAGRGAADNVIETRVVETRVIGARAT